MIYFLGVWVYISHNLIVASPEPDARFLQSGLKLNDNTAYVCPYILDDALVIGLTLKLDTGWYNT